MADIDNPIKYSDLIRPDDTLDALIDKLQSIDALYNKLANDIKSDAAAIAQSLQGVSGATEAGRKSIAASAADAERLEKAYHEAQRAISGNADALVQLRTAQQRQNELLKFAVDMNTKNEGSHKALTGAISEQIAKVQALKDVQSRSAKQTKLMAQAANSAEGSYDQLSAKYRLIKEQLNAMGAEERKNTEEGRALEEQARSLYEEMDALQRATGKYQLNVGNYASAAQGLRMELRDLTAQLAAMKLAGQEGTEEYNAMAQRAGELRDAMSDASQAVKNLASDTSQLDTIMSAMGAASGGFAAAIGAMELFGAGSEDVAEAQKKLQAAMAITIGLSKVQNALQKQSALMLGISKIQTLALAKAEAYERLIKIQQEKATLRATIAQKAFNLVAMANPYVLLAMAIVTVVGALLLFSKGTESAAEKQKKLNEYQIQYIEYLERVERIERQVSDRRIQSIKNELAVARARNASIEEIRKIEDRLAAEEKKQYNERKNRYREYVQGIEQYKANIEKASEGLIKLQEIASKDAKAKVTVTVDGKKTKMKVDEAIEYFQSYIDSNDKKLSIGMEVKSEGEKAEQEARERAAQRAQEDYERWKEQQRTQTEAERAAVKERFNLIKDSYLRQRAEAATNAKNQIEDIKWRLAHEKGLTTAARESLNKQIVAIRKRLLHELEEINKAQLRADLQTMQETEAMRIDAMDEGQKKELAQLRLSYENQRNELEDKLLDDAALTKSQKIELNKQLLLLDKLQERDEAIINDKWLAMQMQAAQEATQTRIEATREGSQQELDLKLELIDQQRTAELEANRITVEELRQDEADINAKYDAMALRERGKFLKQEADMQAEVLNSELELMRTTERKKEQIALEIEAQRLKKIIELVEGGTLEASTAELTLYRNQYEKAIKDAEALRKFGTKLSDKNDLKQSLQDVATYTLEILATVTEARVKMAEAAVEAADKEVESAQRTLEMEREAAANGYASNQELAEKELESAKENQRKALEQQRRAQKQQQAIDTLQQISSLVTASASMWKDLGWPMALVGIATMWASFAASKIMAARMAKQNTEQYAEGTVELLQGGSHASGNDIDLGTKPDGTRRRAEGGEFFAVINKRNSRRYRKEIPQVINALNDGSFNRKYMRNYDGVNGNGVGVTVSNTVMDISRLEGDVRKIRENGETRTYIDASGQVITKYKNLTRREKR